MSDETTTEPAVIRIAEGLHWVGQIVGPPAVVQAAVEAESDRLALRTVCNDEAMYERALADADRRGWSVVSMYHAVASGWYTEDGWTES